MIVVDASVLADAVGDGGHLGTQARRVIRGAAIQAPESVYGEAVNALRGRWLGKKLTEQEFFDGVEDILDLAMTTTPVAPLMRRAFELRHNLTPYDASYVALAESLDCPLVTGDRRLATAPGPQCEFIVLGD